MIRLLLYIFFLTFSFFVEANDENELLSLAHAWVQPNFKTIYPINAKLVEEYDDGAAYSLSLPLLPWKKGEKVIFSMCTERGEKEISKGCVDENSQIIFNSGKTLLPLSEMLIEIKDLPPGEWINYTITSEKRDVVAIIQFLPRPVEKKFSCGKKIAYKKIFGRGVYSCKLDGFLPNESLVFEAETRDGNHTIDLSADEKGNLIFLFPLISKSAVLRITDSKEKSYAVVFDGSKPR